MAAPDDTTWGAAVNGGGRIGISITRTDYTTFERATVSVWFWSKYSVSDSSNAFSYGVDGLASQGSRSISHTVSSGAGWSTSNQTLLGTFTHDFAKGTSQVTHYLKASFSGINAVGGTMSAERSYTVFTLPTYTVTFVNGYGGTISTQTVYHGYNASAPSNPTRPGYTFAGWSGSYTGVNSTRTITATWTPNTYHITYDLNGGDTGPASPQAFVFNSGAKISSTIPTKPGYKFINWWFSNTNSFNPGDAVPADWGDMTLVAQWALDVYVITYKDNGGTGGPGTQNITVNTSGTIPEATPTRLGYTFLSWRNRGDSVETGVANICYPGDTITPISNVTFDAVWSMWKYTVKFDANGGYGSVPNDISATTEEKGIIGSTIPKSACGRMFLSWNTKPDGTGESFNPGDVFDKPQDGGIVTLYAMYYSTDIYFNANGSIECMEFIEDSNCTVPMFEKTGVIIAKEFIEHDGDIMFQGGILYAKSFIEKQIGTELLQGKHPTITHIVLDKNNNVLVNTDG